MISGHLAVKKGKYYAVLELKDSMGRRKPKWIPTKLPVKGNKKRADDFLQEQRKKYSSINVIKLGDFSSDMSFSDYISLWYSNIKATVKSNTYKSYGYTINSRIIPYFQTNQIALNQINALAIETYMATRLKVVGGNTVNHERGLIYECLEYAVNHDLITSNPCAKVKKINYEKHLAHPYSTTELQQLLSVSSKSSLIFETIILIAIYYGLRRSEIVGLKWSSLNLREKIITISSTVTDMGGERFLSDTDKTASGNRSMILFPELIEKLEDLQRIQEHNKKICGGSYKTQYIEYVFVNDVGELLKPAWVSKNFAKLLKDNNMRHIRLHDLRHSCASVLLNRGVSLSEIQGWLGHKSIVVTRDTYGHLDPTYSKRVAGSMSDALGLSSIEDNGGTNNEKSDRKQR